MCTRSHHIAALMSTLARRGQIQRSYKDSSIHTLLYHAPRLPCTRNRLFGVILISATSEIQNRARFRTKDKKSKKRDSGAENTRRIIDHILSCSLFAKMKKHKKCKDIVLAGDPGPVLGEGFHLYSFIGIFFLCARRFEHFPEVGKFQFGCAKSLS